jgi:tetratricopeptide (TPR) repeat protein
MGGIGKTELAVQYVFKYLEEYLGGICWINCRQQDIEPQIVSYARSLLKLSIPEDLELSEQIKYCWQNWQDGKVLLVYDDVSDYNFITNCLPPSTEARFKVLLTSCQKLLDGKNRLDLDVLNSEAALELLRSLVGNERIDAELDGAKALCAWLGYLPLAIELVGSYLQLDPFLTVAEAQEQLKESSLKAPLLEDQGFSGSVAQKGVAAAFELSCEKLSPAAQEMGCRLSLFAPAPIEWEWVERCYPSREIKDKQNREKIRNVELFARNLLQASQDKKYSLHPLIREFFILKLQEISESVDDWKRDLCRVMVEIVKQIPQTVTLGVIESFSPSLPHLREVGENLVGFLEDEDLVWPFVGLGGIYKAQSQFSEAEKWYKKSVKVTREQLGERHPDVASSFNNLAALYDTMGRYEDALPLYTQALEISLEQLGERHPDVASSYNNLAALYESMGRYEEALPLYQQALEIRLEQLRERHPDVATSFNNLAALYESMGSYPEAITHYQQAMSIAEETLGQNHPNTITVTNNYLQMLLESPVEEILKALPEEMQQNYLQMRREWDEQKALDKAQ